MFENMFENLFENMFENMFEIPFENHFEKMSQEAPAGLCRPLQACRGLQRPSDTG